MIDPLVGIDGQAGRLATPVRGDLGPALDRLGDMLPGRLLMATDFDGTLAPIVADPAAASALPANLALIDRLIDLGVRVTVISGRGETDLSSKIALRGPRLLGENGVHGVTAVERRALDRFNARAGGAVARWPGVWLERKPASSSVHYRNAPDRESAVREMILPMAGRFRLVAMMGRMVVEVRPRRADKAQALMEVIDDVQPAAVVFAGDDEPDQEAFRALHRMRRNHLAVGVSSYERPASRFPDCDLVVPGPEGMTIFLRALLERVARGARSALPG